MSKAYFQKDALSNSGIKEILKSPAHFRYWTDNPKEDNSAFRCGRAFHGYMENPERDDILTFCDTKTFNSKAGEAFLKTYGQDHICLTMEEKLQVSEMVNAMNRQVNLMALLGACRREVEIYGKLETSHGTIDMKAMLDALDSRSIFDYKSTSESARDFPWTARRYQYDIQAAWYQQCAFHYDGFLRDFYFIVVEKNPPYGVLLYQAGEQFMNGGREKIATAIEIYGRCKALNLWPGYDTNDILILN